MRSLVASQSRSLTDALRFRYGCKRALNPPHLGHRIFPSFVLPALPGRNSRLLQAAPARLANASALARKPIISFGLCNRPSALPPSYSLRPSDSIICSCTHRWMLSRLITFLRAQRRHPDSLHAPASLTLPASAAPRAGTSPLSYRRLSYGIFRDVDCGGVSEVHVNYAAGVPRTPPHGLKNTRSCNRERSFLIVH